MSTCARPNCTRVACYGYRGLCRFHHDAQQRQFLNAGSLLARGRVDAAPVMEHINKLRDDGMGWQSISHHSGVPTVTLWRIPKQKTVNAHTAARIMRVENARC